MNFDIEEIRDYINKYPDAKIYLGVDSQRMKKKKKNTVRFACVVVVHYDGHKGAKVFHELQFEDVIDGNLGKPFNRMMREVSIVTEVYHALEDILVDREFEIHLDINPDESCGSNIAHGAAKGMIWGTVGVEPVFKPDAFAATCAADKFSK